MIDEMQDNRPAYVQFETREEEDRAASVAAGHYVPRDRHYAVVTPPGGNLTIEKPVDKFLKEKRKQNDPNIKHYEAAYEAWKEGQEEPLEGTPVKSWPAASPAQIKACLNANIKTVEDLATAPEEALKRIGMGARHLQQKAEAWLKSASEHGKVAEEIANLRRDLESTQESLKSVQQENERLKAQLDDDPPRKRGRPKKTQQEMNDADT